LLDSFISRPARERSLLTHRERSIVELVAKGYTNKQIDRLLKISVKTVETHRGAIRSKLNHSLPAALIRYPKRNHIPGPGNERDCYKRRLLRAAGFVINVHSPARAILLGS